MLRVLKALAVAAALCLPCACANSAAHARSGGAQRIVSIMPSLTEDLCAIGARARLVGVSEFSDDIACAKGLPRVSSFSSIDVERIIALHTDAVVAIPAQRAMTAPLHRAGIYTVYLKDDSYADLFTDIRTLGALTDRSRQASALITALRRSTRDLRASEHFHRRPSVFVVLQAQPIWTVGPQSYISTLIDLAGGRNAVTNMTIPYAQFSAEALLRLHPDVIVAASDTQLTSLLTREPWRSLSAVRSHHLYMYPSALLDRPGPRYNEGISWLIEHLRPLAM